MKKIIVVFISVEEEAPPTSPKGRLRQSREGWITTIVKTDRKEYNFVRF